MSTIDQGVCSPQDSSLYTFSFEGLDGKTINLGDHKDKVLLLINVASLWSSTRTKYPQLNDLQEKYGQRGFQVLAFPCNQFGLQENSANEEIFNMLKYVRPGNGFEPNFPLSKKISINGEKTHPLYKWLKEQVNCKPFARDTWVIDETPSSLTVTPCKEREVRWNFEMFLTDRTGKKIKRYHPKQGPKPSEIVPDIEGFLGESSH